MSSRSSSIVLALALGLLGSYGITNHDGGDYGNGNDQRRCHNSENCRGSFSPGPFDRSPVDIHDNQVCISPDCSSRDKDKDQQPSD